MSKSHRFIELTSYLAVFSIKSTLLSKPNPCDQRWRTSSKACAPHLLHADVVPPTFTLSPLRALVYISQCDFTSLSSVPLGLPLWKLQRSPNRKTSAPANVPWNVLGGSDQAELEDLRKSPAGLAEGRRARLPSSKATESETMTSVFSADRRNTSVISPKGY